MNSILSETIHRPWPLPLGPWIMAQTWHDLLFAHWPIPEAQLRPFVPRGLLIDTFAGQAWLGVVPFRMSRVRLRGTPPLPWLSAFPELNVRTYLTAGGKPGVWFFSLDAANALAVAIARAWFHLPYFRARMTSARDAEWILYRSRRTHRGALPGAFRGRYRPTGAAFHPKPGSLEHFLTERYCLYAAGPAGQLFRSEIHHLRWPLQPAEAQFEENTMPQADGLSFPSPAPPVLHFAKRQDVLVWSPRHLNDAPSER